MILKTFYPIPLPESDAIRFAFTVSSINNKKPVSQYYWKVLPQGMLNSPTLCQLYISQPLKFIRKQFPHAYIIHYMNDILLASPSAEELQRIFLNTEIKVYLITVAVSVLIICFTYQVKYAIIVAAIKIIPHEQSSISVGR